MQIPTPMRALLASAALLAATLAVAPPPTTRPAAPTAPPTAPSLETRWSTVLDQLASDSFKDRQSAQKEVDKATWRDLPALKALAAKVTDPEVKDRLLARVDALEVEAALNPPPIDLDLDNASLRDLSIALEKATGIPWHTWNQGGPPQPFTLHAHEKPLWNVFMALNAQHGLRLQPSGDVELLLDPQGVRRGDLQGPLLFYPLKLARSLDLQAPDGDNPPDSTAASPHLEFSFGVMGDPRLKIAKSFTPQITEAVDDKGNVLFRGQPQFNSWSSGGQILVDTESSTWPIPEDPGKKITVKGTMKLSIVVSETTVEIPDMVKQGKTPIVVGDEQIVWDKFEPKDNVINFNMSVQKKGGGFMNGDSLPIHITLTDNSGNQIISQSISGGWGGGLGTNNANGPIKGTFSIPTRTEDRTFTFQFKDLPIP
ncbi:MAG TPA: hypothetical protein VH253_15260 [Phycisphaerae bacterium]|nr:hypothetical protein [Phycisphaerae bacterium]